MFCSNFCRHEVFVGEYIRKISQQVYVTGSPCLPHFTFSFHLTTSSVSLPFHSDQSVDLLPRAAYTAGMSLAPDSSFYAHNRDSVKTKLRGHIQVSQL